MILIRQPLFVRQLARSPTGPGLQWCAAEAAGSAESPTGCWRNFVARRTVHSAGPWENLLLEIIIMFSLHTCTWNIGVEAPLGQERRVGAVLWLVAGVRLTSTSEPASVLTENKVGSDFATDTVFTLASEGVASLVVWNLRRC